MLGVGAVLLAAGASTRYGAENKLAAEIDGRPLVRIVADFLAAAGLLEIIVVTGAGAEEVERALAGLPARFARNARWQSGMGSSIAAGVSALSPDIAGAFVVPGDMPLLTAPLLRRLIAEFERNGGEKIVYPATPRGEQRNPVLWPREYFPELRALSGREGAKALLKSLSAECVALACDPVAFVDIDTPADLAKVSGQLERSPAPPSS
jgi:molybdenum cofactor cytidylyltransferase